MNPRTKSIIRKIIYIILFLLMAVAFVFLSEKYASNSQPKVYTIKDYYPDNQNTYYEVVTGTKMISLLRNGHNLIFIGSSSSQYSQKYIEEIDKIFNELKIDKVYYYDLNNDKYQKNSNYYEIRELLEGYLTTTDDNTNNLLAPSLYIVNNGQVEYYNTGTSTMKNTSSVESYWSYEQELIFQGEITNAINKYYLNK